MSIKGTVSGNKSKTTQTTNQQQGGTQSGAQQQRVDPNSQAFIDMMRKQGLGAQQMVQGHPNSFIAGPTDAFNQGLGAMARVAGMEPNVQASTVGAGPSVTAQQINRPGFDPASFDFTPGQVDPNRIQDFQDPHEQQVIQGLQQDFQRQREAGLTAAQQQATAAGAFGGSRGEILQSQALRDVNQAEAQQLAQVRSSGFSQGLGATMQEHQTMQNLGLGAAQGRLQAQTTGAGMGLQADIANQAAALQAQGMNQQAALQAAMANQQASLQAEGINMQGMGLALQGGQSLAQGGEMQRQIFQQQMQEPIMRAQLGQDFMQGALGPVGMDQTSQQQFNQWMQEQQKQKQRSFGMQLGFGGG